MKKPPSLSVLVADDTADLLALITAWLEDAGHRVVRAANGREVIALAQQQRFDLIVTDILMPDGDGWDAIAEVQRVAPQTRILAMSGGAREMPANAVLRVARGAGAIGMLQKPFSRPDFFDAVARVMATNRAAPKPPDPKPGP